MASQEVAIDGYSGIKTQFLNNQDYEQKIHTHLLNIYVGRYVGGNAYTNSGF